MDGKSVREGWQRKSIRGSRTDGAQVDPVVGFAAQDLKGPTLSPKTREGWGTQGHSEFLCPTKECVSELQFPEEHPMKPYKLCWIIFASTVLAGLPLEL